ncbi:MAG TPA: hypothetical protein VGN57_17825 [Pirellulaceae bacterium]|jgi:hypothetical protein|nr:hypothetical protein [Pirellulaceae bacterium]
MSGRTLVFAVGAETCLDEAIPPTLFAENDAKKFADAWKDLGAAEEESATLTGVQATLTSARSRLRRFLKHVQPGDCVVGFYAGQGVTLGGETFLALHDTQTDDAEGTSLPLADLLASFAAAKAGRIVLFLDIAHGGFPVEGEPQDFDAAAAEDELRDFCEGGDARLVFVSCGPGERSHSSRKVGHGLWTHALLRALRGEEPKALAKKRLLTARSLQAHLEEALPRDLRETMAGAVAQTPRLLGRADDAFALADLDALLGRKKGTANVAGMLPRASLVGLKGGRVRDLSGYKKPKQPLGSGTRWEREFVQSAGVREVSEAAEALFEEIRSSFDFKRREVSFACDGPTASIRTPAFDVDLSLDQDQDDATRYVLSTQASAFRRPEIVSDPEFLRLFNERFDRVVIELETPLDVEAKIDEIEDSEALADQLEYDRDATWFALQLPGLPVRMHATASRIAFLSDGRRDLASLIQNASQAVAYLAGAGATLKLPGS